MKLPFDLGVKLFFRLIVPGFFFTLCLTPALFTVLDLLHWRDGHELGFGVSVMVSGWLITVSDMPIYMLFEGRRFWPAKLREWLTSSEASRLTKIHKKLKSPNRRESLEAAVNVRQFPRAENGDPAAKFPTRLGNLVTAFETYPDTRYGMDAVFFWPRIWIHLDKDTRESLDGIQSIGDSAVYSCFALYAGALFWMATGVVRALGVHPLGGFGLQPGAYVPGAWPSIGAAALAGAAGYAMYRAALHANAQFGEYFKAAFDVHVTRLEHFADEIFDVETVIQRVERAIGTPGVFRDTPIDEKLRVAWRYLHNWKIKCGVCGEMILAPVYQAHLAAKHPGPR